MAARSVSPTPISPRLSFAESYRLANTARSKLSRAARKSDHDLRVLVSHANLLDNVMAYLSSADAPRRRAPAAYPARVSVLYDDDDDDDEVVEEYEVDSDSDSESSEDDSDDEEDIVVDSRNYTHMPPPSYQSLGEDAEEDNSDDDSDELRHLNDLREQLLRSSVVPSSVPEDRPRTVSFSLLGQPRVPVGSEEQFSRYAEEEDDEDDTTLYEAANRYKSEDVVDDDLEYDDDDMPPLSRVASHSADESLPQLTHSRTVSDDDEDEDEEANEDDNELYRYQHYTNHVHSPLTPQNKASSPAPAPSAVDSSPPYDDWSSERIFSASRLVPLAFPA
ncbi:uncharacterized protein V1518DRAFT_412623 [Limtongia smithiae]|uniref:uncharacterized protein n=1 Tax=Limtongia smithiae TaxID=1125753 RepID=UPI0034CE8F4C